MAINKRKNLNVIIFIVIIVIMAIIGIVALIGAIWNFKSYYDDKKKDVNCEI